MMRRAAIAALLVLGGCDAPPRRGVPPEISFESPRSDLFDGSAEGVRQAFNALAADMDLDGDPDLLVNQHILAQLELYENVGGRFRLINPGGADLTGLYENRGIPWLYGDLEEMLPRVLERRRPGVYLWHATARRRMWHLVVVFDPATERPASLRLAANRPLRKTVGLEESEVERIDPFSIRVRLAAAGGHRHFKVGFLSVATRLEVEWEGDDGVPPPAFYVGSDLVEVAGGSLELWKPDPHGIAWVDVAGSPAPDLFIPRGGIQGRLQPPHDPKTDRLYVAGDGKPVSFRLAAPGVVPPGYGRGRQVEWVDVDNDGRCELYIGNRSTPNTLLAWDPEAEVYRDAAAALGLDFESGQTFAWLDLDDDGFQDLLVGRGPSIEIAWNRAGKRFERAPGGSLGLELPAPAAGGGTYQPLLQVADLDNDGRLDLLANGGGRLFLFLRDGPRFVDATAERGLADATGVGFVLLLDADNDGRQDLLGAGPAAVLWVNGGAGFSGRDIAPGWPAQRLRAGAALDADGDGLQDLALVTSELSLLRNATTSPGDHLRVALEGRCGEVVGALARAFYNDGTVRAQRYGSAANAAYCQALQPLHFGVPSGVVLEEIEVAWPGGGTVSRHAVAPGSPALRLRRPGAGEVGG